MIRTLLAVFLLLAGTGWTAQAMADDKFTEMDTDKNGQVIWEEFQAAYPNMKKPAFEAIDVDKNSSLSHEEWDGFRAAHAKGRPMGGSGMSMPPAGAPGAQPGKPEMPLIRPPKS